MHGYSSTKISIVVPMLNEEDNLPNLFESIKGQVLPKEFEITEIIAVDNGSVDKSSSIAAKYCSAVCARPDDTIAEMRNFGASRSHGEILIFLDADCILSTDVVYNVGKLLEDESIAAVGPDGLMPFSKTTWVQQTWYLHTKVLGDKQKDVEVETLSSGFLAIRARDFSEVNGFNGALTIGEDTDISRKLRSRGLKLIRSNRLRVHNSGHPKTLLRFIKREFWHGDSFHHLVIHRKLEVLTMYFLGNSVAIACSIVALIGFNSLKFCLMYVFFSSLIPFAKAARRTGRLSFQTCKLFVLYFLYVNARSASLFKLR